MPLLALSREKTTDKEKKKRKNIIGDIVTQKKERQRVGVHPCLDGGNT